jgi:hypothetical protein
MSPYARRARAAVTVTAMALGGLLMAAPLASASVASTASVVSTAAKVPFTDPGIHGWITFCSRNDKPVTSGSLDTVPFAWKSISSAQPPTGYAGASGRVALWAYQPIQYVDPGDWSGSLLTAASAFSNPAHPVVQATNADQPLVGFTQAYPEHWDGLLEIRMMYTDKDKEQLSSPYAAAVLRVTGNNWTLVEGGGGSCSQGQGLSMETVSLPKKELAKQETAGKAGQYKGTVAGGSAGNATGSGGHTSGGSASGGSAADGSAGLAGNDSSSGINGAALAGIGVGAFALVWVGLTVFSRLRRRSAS